MLTVYKASAGSGKTYALAKDYILLLLGKKLESGAFELNLKDGNPPRLITDNRHRHILAITFTRKATEEMKSRIVAELKKLRDLTPASNLAESYAQDFLNEQGWDPMRVSKAAKIALSQLLFDYQNFNVSTIDSFFQRVLHTFARELDRATDYNVEINVKAAMQQAVGAMFDNFNSSKVLNPTLEQWLYTYLTERIQEGSKTNIFNRNSILHKELVKQLETINLEDFKEKYGDKMRKYLEDPQQLGQFSKDVGSTKAKLLHRLKDEARRLMLDPQDPVDFSGFRYAGLPDTIQECFMAGKMPAKGKKAWDDSNYVRNMIDSDDSVVFKKNCGTPAQAQRVRELVRYAAEIYKRISAVEVVRNTLRHLYLILYAWKFLQINSESNNVLLLSDTNELLRSVIGDDDAPFIYERMGVQLNHFLIDEFQDTSKMQWENLLPLLRNALGESHDSLVIGDEKQSIYRFRNSDSSILGTKVEDEFRDRCLPKGAAPGENTNYRSARDVVRFNNTLFAALDEICAEDPDLGALTGFGNVVQSISARYAQKPAYISLRREDKPATIDTRKLKGKEREEAINANEEAKKQHFEGVMHDMAKEMLRQHDQGGYQWRDIAILVDTNKNAQDIVAFLLKNYGDRIRILSEEALQIINSRAVQLIVNVLRMIDNGVVRKEQANDPNQPQKKKYLRPDEVALVLNRFQYNLNEMPDDAARALERAMKSLDDDIPDDTQKVLATQNRKPASLTALVESIIGDQLTERDRREQCAYISAFQDAVINFCSNFNGSLHAFLDWWDANGEKINIGGDANDDAVRVMTLHKSKGLEFSCVHIPLCNWKLFGRFEPSLWMDLPEGLIDTTCPPPAVFINYDKSNKDNPYFKSKYAEEHHKALIDTMNKTYVAFTRARIELTVWYEAESGQIGELLLRAIAQGLPKNADLLKNAAPLLIDLAEHANDGSLEIGAHTIKEKKEEDKQPAAAETTTQYEVFFRSDAESYTKVDDSMELASDIDDASQQLDDDYADDTARREGIMLHEIMSLIMRASDLEKAVRTVASRHRLDKEEAEKYHLIASRLLQSGMPEIERWFGSCRKAIVEQPIYLPNIDIIKRPDRVVVCADGSVDVVDYKFTDDPSRVGIKEHHRQVQLYMRMMREMPATAGRRVRGFLCYPRLGKVAEVKDETNNQKHNI